MNDAELTEAVRSRYASAAMQLTVATTAGDCCSATPIERSDVFGSTLYGADEVDGLPDEALLASLGCGNPTAVADLRAGETVLDLGSGGGIDVLLSARRVGPEGFVYGVDMTDEMLEVAERNKAAAGVTNVRFVKGTIEALPLADASIDVVISNCVINLSAHKQSVFAEMHRVLREGGRIGVSDVVAEDHLSTAMRAERGSLVGCIAGALSRVEYETALEVAGFEQVSVEFTHQVAPEMHGAIIKALKPAR